MNYNEALKIKGMVRAQIFDKDMNLLQETYGSNIITSAGKAAMAGLVGNTGAITAFSYLALGTSSTTPVIGDTTLGAELSTLGLSRAAATVSRTTTTVTNDTLRFTYTWTASGSTTVQEVGIFNASSSGTMLAHKLTGALAVVSTNFVIITYDIIFS